MIKINTPCLVAVLFALLGELSATGQGLPGYSSGNYTGVNGVFTNPANIADSRYRWDFNLFGVALTLGNNKASFRKKDFDHFDADTIKNRFFSGGDGPVSGAASLTFTGPSLCFNLGKKSAIALTTQSRLMVNIADLDGKLAKQLFDNGDNEVAYPYPIASSQDMVMNVNGYTAFGLTYARVILSDGKNFLKAGLTLKYLAGAMNGYVQINGIHATVGRDEERREEYLSGASGAVALGFGGVDLNDMSVSDLTDFRSTGFGGDLGLVYEYRPDTSRVYGGQNKYKLKIGLSLMDVGSIRYTRDQQRSGSYQVHIPDGERFYLSTLTDAALDDLTDSLNRYPKYFTPEGSQTSTYKVSLPTTLRLAVDYHLHRSFYVGLAAQAAFTSSRKPANAWEYSAVTLTPRYEGRGIGFFVPMTYSSLSGGTAGLALRLGPLYLGSGSILSAAFGTSRRADAFVGLHFGGLKKKHRVKHVRHPKVKEATPPETMPATVSSAAASTSNDIPWAAR